ncbi:MAG: TetR/AcrR family transcriptional regulator [Campylobacterales bacterium]|nr:TetR/AcrR family transcriptional regulator [Campylobacterales bacterium]
MTNKSVKNSVGRPKTFEKDDVIKLAMNHFWEHGFEGTNLDDLLVAMGIKKSSFYRTFKSKEEVFFLSLNLYKQETFTLLEQLKGEIGVKETLVQIIKYDIDEAKKIGKLKGCLLIDCGKEFYKKHGIISEYMRTEMDDFVDFFAKFVKEGQLNGQITNQLDAKLLAVRYLTLYTGIISSLQAGIEFSVVDDLLFFVEELLK